MAIRDHVRLSGAGVAAAAVLFAAGGGAGAAAMHAARPVAVMAAEAPVPIASLAAASRAENAVVTVRGTVAETFGSRFVLADASGRALVEMGPREAEQAQVARGQAVTVQGRYEDGTIRPMFLVGADGQARLVGPAGHRPHEGPGGPGGRAGGPEPRGPGLAGAAPPPPPPGCPAGGPPPAPGAAPAPAAG